jgi:hypothetical protein
VDFDGSFILPAPDGAHLIFVRLMPVSALDLMSLRASSYTASEVPRRLTSSFRTRRLESRQSM